MGDTYARFARDRGVEISAWRLGEAFARVWRTAPPLVFPGTSPDESARREREAWRRIVRQTFLAADSSARLPDFEASFAALFEHFAGRAAWQTRPGAIDALTALRARGVRCGVASNFDQRLPRILAELAIAPLLDTVLVPGQVGVAKPDAAFFRAALTALGARAEETVFVGDDAERDLAGARAAGLRALAPLANLADLPEYLGLVPGKDADR